MIVTRSNFEGVLTTLMGAPELSLDTETTGLRPYHGDRLFSIIIGVSSAQAFYFNFRAYAGMPEEQVLTQAHLENLTMLFRKEDVLWYLQNAKFDMRILAQEGLFLKGKIHCTKAIGRVEYNNHLNYSLSSQLERIGLKKDDKVMDYVKEHKLWDWGQIPGKATREKLMHFELVPFDIIEPYGEMDGTGTFALGRHQIRSIEKQVLEEDEKNHGNTPNGRSLFKVLENERRITHTVFRMEHVGCLIDTDFCKKAVAFECERQLGFERYFKQESGESYKSSNPLFQRIFESEKALWAYTDKGNASFDSDTLKLFKSPLAQTVLEIRDAKSKQDFYNGFLYHADKNSRLHSSFNPDGAAHGRFSSSDPNFQNLTDEEDQVDQEFIVRRAIIPTPGFKLLSIDWQGMEYRFMLEMACRLIGKQTHLVDLILGGLMSTKPQQELLRQLACQSLARLRRLQIFLPFMEAVTESLLLGSGAVLIKLDESGLQFSRVRLK